MHPLGTLPKQRWKGGWEESSKRHSAPAGNDRHRALELNPAPAQAPRSSGKLIGGPADINVNAFLKLKFAETPALLCSHAP